MALSWKIEIETLGQSYPRRTRTRTAGIAHALLRHFRHPALFDDEAVIPATGRAQADPLVPLVGGPGEETISEAAYFAEQLAPLRRDHDILLVDMRPPIKTRQGLTGRTPHWISACARRCEPNHEPKP
jgi:hypothetical protein